MQRLGRASVRTASSQPAVPACRVVGFTIPSAQCNRCVEGSGQGYVCADILHSMRSSAISLCQLWLAFPCRRTHHFRVQAAAMQQSAQEPSGSSTGGAAVASGPAAGGAAASSSSGTTFDLVCPICLSTPLRLQQVGGRPCGDLRCQRCARTFTSNATFADLTLTAGIQQKAYQQSAWGGTTIFQSPLVSFVYERGWRQGFAWAGRRHCGCSVVWCGACVRVGAHLPQTARAATPAAGFPGVDKEFELAMDYLRPAQGEVLVDMSCGSGLFTRRFLASNRFAGVIAADFRWVVSSGVLRAGGAFGAGCLWRCIDLHQAAHHPAPPRPAAPSLRAPFTLHLLLLPRSSRSPRLQRVDAGPGSAVSG